MRLLACLLLPSVLLAGCSERTPVATPTVTTPPQHSVNRYELHGSPDKVALLVDSETGRAWKYDAGTFVPISVQGLDQVKYFNPETGNLQDTPATAAQKNVNMAGRVRRYNPQTGKIE